MDFNINNEVGVKLNEYGRGLLRKQHDELRAFSPSIGEFKAPFEYSDGTSTWQLHCLMSELGSHVVMGRPLPFETTISIDVNPFPDYVAAPIANDSDGHLLEAALQAGAHMLNDDATVYAYKQDDLLRLIKCALEKDFTPLWAKPDGGV